MPVRSRPAPQPPRPVPSTRQQVAATTPASSPTVRRRTHGGQGAGRSRRVTTCTSMSPDRVSPSRRSRVLAAAPTTGLPAAPTIHLGGVDPAGESRDVGRVGGDDGMERPAQSAAVVRSCSSWSGGHPGRPSRRVRRPRATPRRRCGWRSGRRGRISDDDYGPPRPPPPPPDHPGRPGGLDAVCLPIPLQTPRRPGPHSQSRASSEARTGWVLEYRDRAASIRSRRVDVARGPSAGRVLGGLMFDQLDRLGRRTTSPPRHRRPAVRR